jgi:Fe2+ transport system protein B
MKRFLILTMALVFAGINFAQQTQSGVYEVPNLEVPKHRMEWCRQNWEKCKQMQLKMLSARKECLEKSQSYEAFRSCMAQFREQRRQEMREMKQN